jgi:predicted porin
MKKLPLVLALSAASLYSVANAQSNVQIYGKLYPYLNSERGSSPSPAGTAVSSFTPAPTGATGTQPIKGMAAGNSNIGFRGKEDLGGGMAALFQLEQTVGVDNGAGGTWNRNTFVGLGGGFGQVRLGLMDTVFKEYGDTIGVLGISSGTPMSSSNILRKTPFGTSAASRFHERRANSLRYDSPEFGGVQLGAQAATEENPGNVGAAKTYSVGVKYDSGPIYFALAHEIHLNWFGGSANVPTAQRNNGAADSVKSRDKATQATIEYRITQDHKVEFDVIRKEYNEDAIVTGRFKSYKNTAFLLASEHRFGPWRINLQFVKSLEGSCARLNTVCTTDGLDGMKFLVGGGYSLSKRTMVFAVYDTIRNGKSAVFTNNDFGGRANPGEDLRHLVAGVSHSF